MVSDADKIIDLYERHAHGYVADRGRVRWNESLWLDRFTTLLPEGATILDVGFGSGEPIARYLIEGGGCSRRSGFANADVPLPRAFSRSGVVFG